MIAAKPTNADDERNQLVVNLERVLAGKVWPDGPTEGSAEGCPSSSVTRSSNWSNSWLASSGRQPLKSAPLRRRNARGASTCSINTGTKIPLRLASDASLRTHSDATDTADQSTIAHLASASAFSIT